MLTHVQVFAAPWTIARQVPLSMEFSRQEYWNGLPFPSPEDLPDPEIKTPSLVFPALQANSYCLNPVCDKARTQNLGPFKSQLREGRNLSSKREASSELSGYLDCSHHGSALHLRGETSPNFSKCGEPQKQGVPLIRPEDGG